MAETEIVRSSVEMDKELFSSVLSLTTKHRWLTKKPAELHETLTICSEASEKELVVDLLSRFKFCSASEHLENVEAIAKKIAVYWASDPKSTIIVALENGECADSSSKIVQELKAPFAQWDGWTTGKFNSRLGDAVKKSKKNGGTIVVVDDFAGTGDSIFKKISWLREELVKAGKDVSIKVAVIAAMEQCRAVVEDVADEFFALSWLRRGISDHFTGSELATAIAAMERIETELALKDEWKKIEDYNFGWGRSEALYYAEGANPPNNNFPIFWWRKLRPDRKRSPILRRI